MRLRAAAYAKINLHLEVLGKRADGFHEIRTLLQTIDLADQLEAEPGSPGEISLSVTPRGEAPEDEDNLVVRAARVLQAEAECSLGARILLEKRIPAGAGLGGGSADAAAALVLLDRLWKLDLEESVLFQMGAVLGSDIPFFLRGGLAYGFGRGAETVPLQDLAPMGVLVAWPTMRVPTATVYGMLEAPLTWEMPDGRVGALAAGLTDSMPWGAFRNDLEPVVLEGWPDVGSVFEMVRGTNAIHSGVTGSGAAVFGVYESRRAAALAAKQLSGVGARLVVTETVPGTRAGIQVVEA